MGWAGGSEVCQRIWEAVRKDIPEKKRAKLLAKVVDVLTDQDWDCVHEIAEEWPESRKALEIYDPNFFDYENEEDEEG